MQGNQGGGKVPDMREERKVPGRRVPGKGKEGKCRWREDGKVPGRGRKERCQAEMRRGKYQRGGKMGVCQSWKRCKKGGRRRRYQAEGGGGARQGEEESEEWGERSGKEEGMKMPGREGGAR